MWKQRFMEYVGKIHGMKPEERRELMCNTEEVARLLKKGDVKQAREKITKLTKKE